MARIFSILKTGNHRLCRPNLPSELGLSQSSILPHLADEKSQVNLLQRPREVLTVGRTLASALADKFLVFVAFDGLLHKPHSFRMASFSFCDPVYRFRYYTQTFLSWSALVTSPGGVCSVFFWNPDVITISMPGW